MSMMQQGSGLAGGPVTPPHQAPTTPRSSLPSQGQQVQSGPGAPVGNNSSNSSPFPQQYCLRWKYHHTNIQTMFTQLLERQAYCDITLCCEGQTFKAHQVVLSACSTYFDTILSQHEEKHPIVIMRDVKFSDMRVLVDFMYKGEINIDHSRLSSLLKTAEDLHIKGLAEVSWRSDSNQNDLAGLNSGHHSPGGGLGGGGGGSGPPGVETVLHEGISAMMDQDDDRPTPPKQKRRGRPPLDDPPSAQDVFTPKITCLTGNVGYNNTSECTLTVVGKEDVSEGDQSWDDDMAMPESNEAPMPIQLSLHDSMMDQEKKANTSANSNAMNPAVPEQFRDVIKMNEYLTTGRRQEFWEEAFTRRVMDAIKSKELEMKTAAEILGVSYGTLYGRYRDSYGCLKHPYRVRDFWSEPGPASVLEKLRRKDISLFRAAEYLNVTVHTLATYLSTLQGPDRISLAGDLSVVAAGGMGGPMDSMQRENNDISMMDSGESINDLLLQKMGANVTGSAVAAPTTSATIKREGGGYVELPGQVPKAATSMLDNNPDITIVKAENMQRKRDYAKMTATENNNAKLMSGGAVSELVASQLSHPGQQSQVVQPQKIVTAQTTAVQQQLQQQHQLHQQAHQQKLADTLSINNDISKP